MCACTFSHLFLVALTVLLSVCTGERQFSLDESVDINAAPSTLVLGIRRQISRMIARQFGPRDISMFVVRGVLVVFVWL